MPGRTPLHLPALSATVLRQAFLPSSPKCSTDSNGLPDPLPPSDDPDCGQPCSPCDLSWRSQTRPVHPGLLSRSTFPAPPPSLPSHLAAQRLATSLASRLFNSTGRTCSHLS